MVALLSLLGATLFWAGNYVVGAGAVQSIEPLSLVFLRWAIALVPLLVIAQLVERPNWRSVLAAWPWLVALSVCGLLGYNLLLYVALEHTDAFNASLINSFNPALITLAAAVFLRERLTWLSVAGVLLALAGVLIVISGGDAGRLLTAGFGTGEVLMVGAVVVWTAYTVIGRRAPKIPPVTATAVQAAVAVALLAPVRLATGGLALPSTGNSWASLLFIAVFPSVLSYLLWNRALTVLPASGAGVFLNLITVFTAILTILAGRVHTTAQLVGGAIVIGGVVIANARNFRRQKAGEAQG
ncbi:threonine/homoserine efflux transporter RhtA [Arthrobacter sp. SLBN-112]|jgi:drug/metabolite transporter (DMT)-like permease|uniref:DMT family transporter n=1 Tax=Arthrobacter sp. SLBN-112 TaxID=2768452 RepID=UPI001151DF1D|nr:DMT family transporter [Arthrobacter sp. SLBN-112]TQJ40608.1 threonine/homoserine efflux transporter RhtA [Arthrobacter sp. SLBN-112]